MGPCNPWPLGEREEKGKRERERERERERDGREEERERERERNGYPVAIAYKLSKLLSQYLWRIRNWNFIPAIQVKMYEKWPWLFLSRNIAQSHNLDHKDVFQYEN